MNQTASESAGTVGHRGSFFRQSGWLMVANITGGILMWAVHPLAKVIPKAEYSVFGVLLAVAMCIPTMPLQIVMAQQTADALARGQERQLAGKLRLVTVGLFLLWAVFAGLVYAFQDALLEGWKIGNPAGLWVTVLVVLCGLWLPVFWGVLQGRQQFLGLGWSMMSNGALRFAISVLGVLALGWQAAGMMTGVLAGMGVALGVCVWLARPIWQLTPDPFAWGPFLAQVIPLMLAMAAFQFLFTADTMFAKGYFDGESMAGYVAAGTMARALMWLVGPLATVMFPKLVHSAARAEKSDLMGWVLGGTAALALAGAAGLSLLGPLFVRVIYRESFVEVAATLLPWYAFAMIPLTLSNVLLNNLLARSSFKVVPLLCLLAAGYGVALTQFHGSQVTILQTLGVFNTLMLAACGWFTWADKRKANV